MTTQLSPMRTGRITASRVGAILGVNKYQTRDDVMREMVRGHFGAEPEFTGNDATEYGNLHEDDARTAYEATCGVLVLDAQDFIPHPEHGWIGVSPDGLVGDDGMVEIKCPWRAKYMSVAEKPEYAAQIQLQLACTGRAWCDFVIWRSFDAADRLGCEPLIIERVPADPDWLPSNLATLIRTVVTLGVATALVAWRGEWRAPATIEAKTWLFLVLSGVATGLSWLCYYRALQLGPVGKVAPIDKLSVAIAIVLGIVFLGESLSWPVAIGGGLIVLGSIVLVLF